MLRTPVGWRVKDSWQNFSVLFLYYMVKWTYYWTTYRYLCYALPLAEESQIRDKTSQCSVYLCYGLLSAEKSKIPDKCSQTCSYTASYLDILLYNIPIFWFGSPFGWNVNGLLLPTGQVVALSSQLHSTKLQLSGWLHVDIFNQELCYRINEAYNSNSSLIHPPSSPWVTRMSTPSNSNLSRSTQSAQHDMDKNTL